MIMTLCVCRRQEEFGGTTLQLSEVVPTSYLSQPSHLLVVLKVKSVKSSNWSQKTALHTE